MLFMCSAYTIVSKIKCSVIRNVKQKNDSKKRSFDAVFKTLNK